MIDQDKESAPASLAKPWRRSQGQLYQAQKMKALGTLVAGLPMRLIIPLT